jgi:hypothetical protein
LPHDENHRKSRDFQELWLKLAQRNWKSLVLVPVDPDISVIEIAKTLAEIGEPLSEDPVTAVSLGQALDALGSGSSESERARTKSLVTRIRSMRKGSDAGQLIFAIQPVTVEPLGVLVTRAADAVVLCVRMGHSNVEAVRRSQALIGPERIAGCIVVD